jgi:succinate semialdehyde reductase
MYSIKQPSEIIFGKYSAQKFDFPENCLLITSKGSIKRGWDEYLKLKDYHFFDRVENNPSMDTVKKIISEFSGEKISKIIGLGGGSCLDVAKYCGFKMRKNKILIPTTFGSGSEVTRISVLKINGKKKSFHDDKLFADTAIIDSSFYKNTPEHIKKNSFIDALAQCSEGFDSKMGNEYTKFLCEKAFSFLENGILTNNYEKIVFGSLMSGLGFGNSSTTLGHALSYVFSNEGVSHGHALAFTTTVAHKYNNSRFYSRFIRLVKKLNFPSIFLEQNIDEASEIILTDKKHLDNNPKNVCKEDILSLLKKINSGNTFRE